MSWAAIREARRPRLLASSVLDLAPLGGQAWPLLLPFLLQVSPRLSAEPLFYKVSSRVPAETTKSPVAFPKFPRRLPAMSQGRRQPWAPGTSLGRRDFPWDREGGRGAGAALGSIALLLGLQRPRPWLALWVGDPRCVCYSKTG